MKNNILIKGDNLKELDNINELVDIIYIDPPYFFYDKKPNDYLAYDSNFTKESWTNFLIPRLEKATKLMHDNSIIYVSTNDDGLFYLKEMLDKVFNINNYIATLIVPRYSGQNKASFFVSKQEYVLCYTKNKKEFKKNIKLKEIKPWFKEVFEIIEENKKKQISKRSFRFNKRFL